MQNKKAKTVNEYIKTFPPKVALKLRRIQTIIKKLAPKADERISYHIPQYKLNEKVLVYFAAFENHISLYPRTKVLEKTLRKALAPYKSGKGTIKFPLDKSLPVHLVQKIITIRVKENLSKKKRINKNRGFVGILSLLIAIAVIAVVYFGKTSKTTTKNSPNGKAEYQSPVDLGIDAIDRAEKAKATIEAKYQNLEE